MKKNLLMLLLILSAAFVQPHPAACQPASQAYAKANKLFAEGKYPEALQTYQSILSALPVKVSESDVRSRIGDCYFRLQDYQNAVKAYRSALPDQKPSQKPQTQYWIGFSSFLLGRDSEAVDEFLKIPELYPSSGMWVGTAYYWAGRASERMGRKEQAADFYRKAGGKGKSTQEQFAIKRAEAVKKGPGYSSQGTGKAGPKTLNPEP
jgi:tetratricopeptide (TPR) repeat protein